MEIAQGYIGQKYLNWHHGIFKQTDYDRPIDGTHVTCAMFAD